MPNLAFDIIGIYINKFYISIKFKHSTTSYSKNVGSYTTSHSLMFISLRIDYRRLMETFFNIHLFMDWLPKVNGDLHFKFNWTSYLYYTHFVLNIYWHFIQKPDKIPKTHKFWGLKSIFDILFAYLLDSFKPLFSGIFKAFVYYLFITGKVSYAPLLFYYTSESWFL